MQSRLGAQKQCHTSETCVEASWNSGARAQRHAWTWVPKRCWSLRECGWCKMYYVQCKTFCIALCSLSFAGSTVGDKKRSTLSHVSCCSSCGVVSVHAINLSLYTMYTDTSLSGTWSTLQYSWVQYRCLRFTLLPHHNALTAEVWSQPLALNQHTAQSHKVAQSGRPATPGWNRTVSAALAGL